MINFLKKIDQKLLFGLVHNIFQKIRSLNSLLSLKKIEYNYKIFYTRKKKLKLSDLADVYGVDKGYSNFSKRKFKIA